jgi:S-(hydroxymethyl)glutathione dehydrogenase/alcohol dehydrogenase
MNMRAAIFDKPGAPLTVESVAPLALGPTDVLVRVTASGICHSDLGPARGALGDTGPTVLGHEGAGVVDTVGSNVATLRPGDRVIATWVAPCDRCFWCINGQAEACAGWPHAPAPRFRRGDGTVVQSGLGALGTFAEAMIVDERALVPVATDLPDEQLALIGCGVTTGVCAVFNTAGVTPGSSVAVSGLGGVGQSVIQGARIAGAATIVAIDPVAMKRAFALELGATHAIDPAAPDAVDEVRSLTGGRGVDQAFEVSGHPAAAKQSYSLVRRGGTLVLVGLQPPDATPPWAMREQLLSGKRVVGSLYGGAQVRRDFPRLVRLVEAGLLDLGSMVTRRLTLDQVNEGLDLVESGEVIRSVMVMA